MANIHTTAYRENENQINLANVIRTEQIILSGFICAVPICFSLLLLFRRLELMIMSDSKKKYLNDKLNTFYQLIKCCWYFREFFLLWSKFFHRNQRKALRNNTISEWCTKCDTICISRTISTKSSSSKSQNWKPLKEIVTNGWT